MIALILGAGGQVGRALAATAPPGSRATALDRGDCDVLEPGEVERAIANTGAKVVFNAAAYTAVDRAESEPELARALNCDAAARIAHAAREAGARTVQISTDFVFDGTLSRPYRTDDVPAPLGVYGRTKLDGERAVSAADHGALIVRSAWIYALAGHNFLLTMLRLMRERSRLEVVADQIGTPTLASSLASALWNLASTELTGIWHFTDAGVASWYDFAVAIEEEARALGLIEQPVEVRPIPTSAYPTPARRPAFSVLDKTKTWEALGRHSPHWRTNLRAALKEIEVG